MTINTRAEFENAQRATDKALRALFEQMINELVGIVSQAANSKGVIPPAKGEEVRQKARTAVMRYFVQERSTNGLERDSELKRLQTLIENAQKAMRGATQAHKTQLRGRVSQLSSRIILLEKGTALDSLDDKGNGLTAYARALRTGVIGAIRDVIAKHAEVVRARIADARLHDR